MIPHIFAHTPYLIHQQIPFVLLSRYVQTISQHSHHHNHLPHNYEYKRLLNLLMSALAPIFSKKSQIILLKSYHYSAQILFSTLGGTNVLRIVVTYIIWCTATCLITSPLMPSTSIWSTFSSNSLSMLWPQDLCTSHFSA